MTVSARRLGLFPAADLMISIAAPTATMALNVRLSEKLGKERFTVEVTLMGAPTLLKSPKPREGSGDHPVGDAPPIATLTARTARGCPIIRLVGENFPAPQQDANRNSGSDFHAISCFFTCRSAY